MAPSATYTCGVPAPETSPRTHRRLPWERIGLAGLALAVASVGVFLVAPAVEEQSAPDVRAEFQALLDSWADAVRTADSAALAEVVDAAAGPELLEAEIRRAQALSGVPLTEFGYELGIEPAADVPDGVVRRFGDDPVLALTVSLRYGIEGVDEAPTHKPVVVLVVERSDGWKIASDRPLPDSASVTWRGPWDHGPLDVRIAETAGGTSTILAHPDRAALAEDIADELPSAVDAVSDVWGTDWPEQALVLVTSSRDEFTDQVGTAHNGDEIAAVAISDAVDPEHGQATGRRIVFSPAAGSRLSREGLRAVLRHELTHIAARPQTVDGSPMWILEGYADHIGYRSDAGSPVTGTDLRRIAPNLAVEVSRNGAPSQIPTDDDFADPVRSRIAYETAWSLATFLAEEYGEDELTSLYRTLADGPVSEAGQSDAFTATVGVSAADVVDRWGDWLTDLV